MTRRVDAINMVSPGAYIEIHPDDADKLKVRDGDIVKVTSRRGSLDVKVMVSGRPSKGVVFIPFHYREAAANLLTNTALGPCSQDT